MRKMQIFGMRWQGDVTSIHWTQAKAVLPVRHKNGLTQSVIRSGLKSPGTDRGGCFCPSAMGVYCLSFPSPAPPRSQPFPGPRLGCGQAPTRHWREAQLSTSAVKETELPWFEGGRRGWQTLWLFPSPALVGKKMIAHISGRLKLSSLTGTQRR